jgi:hypothetical protein
MPAVEELLLLLCMPPPVVEEELLWFCEHACLNSHVHAPFTASVVPLDDNATLRPDAEVN